MIPTPDGMTPVSKDEFFFRVGRLDVHPRNLVPHYTTWETPSRAVVGQSYPGWKNPGDEVAYFINKEQP